MTAVTAMTAEETASLDFEKAIREREERYRLVCRATNDVIWDWDLDTNRVERNEAILQYFGVEPGEPGPSLESWSQRIHPEDVERVTRGIREAIESGKESWTDEYRLRKSDGSYATVLDRGYIARDASGKAYRVIGSMLDLTERRRVEAALRESELFHRQLIESIPGMVFTNRPDGSCDFASEQWVEYTGVPTERLLGDGWGELPHPDDRARVIEAWRAAFTERAPYDLEYRVRRRDGEYEWFKVRGRPIRDASGRIVRWFGMAINVHDLKMAEEALREADRRKDHFLAMLAHELRNPLAPIRTAVYLLRKLGPREPALDRIRDIIDRQVTHMARLIDDLLDVSRIGRGKIDLRRERCDLVQIVRQTAEDYRASLEAGGVTLSVRAPDAPLWVDGDRTRLAQIIGNLLHNAGKFTPPGGRVDVRVEADAPPRDSTAVVTIEDTGIGIEPALLPRLFDPFSQGDQGIARSKGGLGLGLALVKGLVELHGGAVAVHSEGPDRGTTFTVRIPVAVPVTPATPNPASEAPSRRLRVLVIEDNRDAAETLEMALSLAGHEVTVALDGPAGLEAARAVRPHVVVCDIGLPGGTDGHAVARALRADRSLAQPFLVALSGYGQEEDQRRSREAGFDVHLVKPVDLKALEALVAGVSPGPAS